MSDDHSGGELPADPFSSYDAERAAREVGGVTVAALQRARQDRLTIGAFEHPHKIKWLNVVTIRLYLDGQQTGALDLDLDEVQGMIAALLQAASICWGVPPGAILPPPGEPGTEP